MLSGFSLLSGFSSLCFFKLNLCRYTLGGAAPDAAQLAALKQLYAELQVENPRSDTCQRFPLDYLTAGGGLHSYPSCILFVHPSIRELGR